MYKRVCVLYYENVVCGLVVLTLSRQELIAACDAALASQERFAQTGAGWVLRYCILERRKKVVEVLTRRGPTMTTEGMRYALEKCKDAGLKKRLMEIAKSGGRDKKKG